MNWTRLRVPYFRRNWRIGNLLALSGLSSISAILRERFGFSLWHLAEAGMTLTAITRRAMFLAGMWGCALPAWAQIPIDVEVATDKGVPLTAPQEWARLLGELQLGSVRLRGGKSDEQPEITQVGGAAGPRFKVLALLNLSGELVLPKRRFRTSDRKALSDYFQELSRQESFGEEKGVFGLTEKQFGLVHADLSRPISFSTKGKTPADVLNLLESKIAAPVVRDAPARNALRLAKPLEVELRDMSAGTALALALRNAGLVLRPQKRSGEPLRIVVERGRPGSDSWPVGWKPKDSPRLVAPKLFEFLTIEIDGYTLTKAIEALEPRMGIPVIYDERILAAREIRPDEIQVKLPAGKTYLKRVVDRLLSQARLAGELRIDERGRPFYWITQFGKDSPRAE